MVIKDDRNFFEKAKVEAKVKFDRVKWNARRAWNWVESHPQEAIAIGLATVNAIGLASKGVGTLANRVAKNRELRVQSCRVWDPVNGVFWNTKKPMTTQQKLEFERRVALGENRGDVLESMKLLSNWR